MSTHADNGLKEDAMFIALAYAIAWACMLPPTEGGLRTALLTVAGFAPTFAALIVTAKQGGARGALRLAKKFFSFRAPILGYALAWWLFPAALFGCFLVFGFTADKVTSGDIALGIVVFAPLNYTVGILLFATVGPQGEELGWRGYLLPRWRSKFGEGLAPLYIGLVWTGWHLPLFLDPSWVAPGLSFWMSLSTYAASVIALSYAIACVSWISRDSLIVCILMHGAVNLSFNMLIGYQGPLHNNGLEQHVLMVIAAVVSAVIAGFCWIVVKRRRGVELSPSGLAG